MKGKSINSNKGFRNIVKPTSFPRNYCGTIDVSKIRKLYILSVISHASPIYYPLSVIYPVKVFQEKLIRDASLYLITYR